MQTDGDGALRCPYCNHSEPVCAFNEETEDIDFSAAEASDAWLEPMQTLRCQNCGRYSIRTAGQAPSACAYCSGGPLVPTDEPAGIRPGWIAPFKLTAAQAGTRVSAWLKKRWLVPFSFADKHTKDSLQGVYLPYWSFNTAAKSSYYGQAGNYYHDTEINTSSSGDRTETKERRVRKIRWRMVSGNYEKKFNDIIFGDAGQTDAKIIKGVEPFKLSELVAYDPQYVAGFTVEHYGAGLKGTWERAKAYMNAILRADITAIVKRGSNVTGTVNICTRYTDVRYRLILLPLWIASYRFKNKVYNVYINGQTGENIGDSPVSALKIGIIAAVVAAVAALLILLL